MSNQLNLCPILENFFFSEGFAYSVKQHISFELEDIHLRAWASFFIHSFLVHKTCEVFFTLSSDIEQPSNQPGFFLAGFWGASRNSDQFPFIEGSQIRSYMWIDHTVERTCRAKIPNIKTDFGMHKTNEN